MGRNADVAWGATNGYSDMVDLYIETIDPANPHNYMQGERSIPFVKRTEKLLIRDRDAEGGYRKEVMQIRATARGAMPMAITGSRAASTT